MSVSGIVETAFRKLGRPVEGSCESAAQAAHCVIDSLEPRRLLAFTMNVDFTSESYPYTVPGFHADIGRAYGDRNNGRFFGWDVSHEAWGRNQDAANSPDERYDGFNHLRDGIDWSVAVPNGRYEVRIVAGDPKHDDSLFHIDAEGMLIVNGTPTASSPWVEGIGIVDVNDEKLTVSSSGGQNNKLAFIEIQAVTGASLPNVNFTDNGADAGEGSGNPGSWLITRTGGDLRNALTVNYTLGGTAVNGSDYETLSGTAIIAAGKASAEIIIDAINDSTDEPNETIVATLAAGNYTIGAAATASCTVIDNDTAIQFNPIVKWSSAPEAPIGRVEPAVVQVGNKLYVMGGFDGDLNVNRRVDIFNLATERWSRGESLPSGAALTHGGAVSDGKFIYLISGQPAGGYSQATSRSYRYDIANDDWERWIDFPTKRFGGACVYLDGKIYYFGGAKSDRHTISNAYWMIDLESSNPTWKQMGNLPLSGDHLGHVMINGRIYIVGGEHGHEGLNSDPDGTYVQHDYLLEYNPATDTFSRKADMLKAASHFEGSIHVINNRLVVFGGNDDYESQTNRIQLWDPATNKWRYVNSSIPDARQGPASGIWNGRIYYANGYSSSLGVTTRAYWGTLSGF